MNIIQSKAEPVGDGFQLGWVLMEPYVFSLLQPLVLFCPIEICEEMKNLGTRYIVTKKKKKGEEKE